MEAEWFVLLDEKPEEVVGTAWADKLPPSSSYFYSPPGPCFVCGAQHTTCQETERGTVEQAAQEPPRDEYPRLSAGWGSARASVDRVDTDD